MLLFQKIFLSSNFKACTQDISGRNILNSPDHLQPNCARAHTHTLIRSLRYLKGTQILQELPLCLTSTEKKNPPNFQSLYSAAMQPWSEIKW